MPTFGILCSGKRAILSMDLFCRKEDAGNTPRRRTIGGCCKHTKQAGFRRAHQARVQGITLKRQMGRIVSTMNCHRGAGRSDVPGVQGLLIVIHSSWQRTLLLHFTFVSPSVLPKFVPTALLSTSTVICNWH